MLEFFIALLIVVLVGALIVGTLFYVVGLLPDPPVGPAAKNILRAIIALCALLAALGWLFGGRPGYPFDRAPLAPAHAPRF